MLKKACCFIAFILFYANVFSQDTLPKFTLADNGSRVTISWTNPYVSLIQLNVQRSYDSLRNYTTVFSATSPELPQNGYTDTKPPATRYYYRIFYVLEGGKYYFTKSQRTGSSNEQVATSRDVNRAALLDVDPTDKRLVTVRIKNSTIRQIPAYAFRAFRDSILSKTRDTLFAINDTLVALNPFIAREAWRASTYVYLASDGYISITVPNVTERKYSIKFFEEDGVTPVFEVKKLKESPLILDKSNFVHAGWYTFELLEDNKLKEKNKFYVPKDF